MSRAQPYTLSASDATTGRCKAAVLFPHHRGRLQGVDASYTHHSRLHRRCRSRSATCPYSYEPKIGIPQLLSLACYAMGVFRSQDDSEMFDFRRGIRERCLTCWRCCWPPRPARAFARGLLHGYRTEEEALYAVRGRIRFDEQIRRRFGIAMPVEVRYDEFTDDIRENRLVKAAVARLGEMRLRSPGARRGPGLDRRDARERLARRVRAKGTCPTSSSTG